MDPIPAWPDDASELADLRDEAATWQVSLGIKQWTPGEVTVRTIEAQISAGEWFVVRRAAIVGALRLLWSDPASWGDVLTESAYVHGLVVKRSHAGRGLGAALLVWVEGCAAQAGRPFVRLDCVESNDRLRRYYEDCGYQLVGRKVFDEPLSPVALFEKRVIPVRW